MGIIYKLKKHKDLIMDLNKQNMNQEYCNVLMETESIQQCSEIRIVNDGNFEQCVERSVSDGCVLKSNNVDIQFTAEHVLQLCKFLAEKSRKNKNLHKQQQSPLKTKTALKSHFAYDDITFTEDTLALLPNARATKSNSSASVCLAKTYDDYSIPHHILQTNNNNNNNNNNDNADMSASTCSQEYSQQQHQGKRDILLKIRHQIFERKRQRQLAHMQQRFGVWRPW